MMGFSESLAANDTKYAASIPGVKVLWNETLGDARISLAILDGPVESSHPSLAAANLTKLETVISGSTTRGSAYQHGTHVASIIFGQHDGVVKGIAPHCRGLIVPVFSEGSDGSIAPCSQLDLARAIEQAVQAGAHIINISGGELSSTDTAHPSLVHAVRNCAVNNVLIIAAAGNEGCDCLHIPGALPSVLAVGAMNSLGLPLEGTNWGVKYQDQGILAPGKNILGAIPGGGTTTSSGTSYATPIVSGVAALLLSLQLKRGLKPDPKVVREAILGSAIGCEEDPVPDCRRLLAGRLNIKGAISIIMKEGEIMSQQKNKQLDIQKTEKEYAKVETSVDNASMSTIGVERSIKPTAVLPEKSMQFWETNPVTTVTNGDTIIQESAVQKGIHVSSCNCNKDESCSCESTSAVSTAYVIGELGFDYGTRANRDSIMLHIEDNAKGPKQLLEYLEKNPWESSSIIWTLNLDGTTPIYAIQPHGAFASEVYQRLRQFLKEQLTEGVERISVGGIVAGQTRLMSGQVVPSLLPVLRCMYNWTTSALIESAIGKRPSKKDDQEKYDRKMEGIRNFLERVYHEIRNLGITSADKALNSAATNAMNVAEVFESAIKENMQLDTIEVERSPVSASESECWDVKLIFFKPGDITQARRVYRFAVDVSGVCPVMVGSVRSWSAR